MSEQRRAMRIGLGSSMGGLQCAALAGVLTLTAFFAPPAIAQEPEPAVAADEADAATHDLDLTGSEIRQVQQVLRERGYFVGPADGRKEERLRGALRDYQRAEGLPVTGSLDKGTLVQLGLVLPTASDQTESSEPVAQEPEPVVEPVAQAEPTVPSEVPSEATREPASQAPPSATKKQGGSGRDVFSMGKAGVKGTGRGVVAAGNSVKTAGKVTGEAVGTGGKAVAKAGTATADAATTSARAVKVGAVAVATSPKALYSAGRRALFGGGNGKSAQSSDEKIRKSLENQYSEDERIIPEEVEIRVQEGHVTLVFPQNPRTDVAYAARLAKLTPGVTSVNAIYQDGSQ